MRCNVQHFDTPFGEYPAGHPQPPFECVNIGDHVPPKGTAKWELLQDNSLRILDERFTMLASGGSRNAVRTYRPLVTALPLDLAPKIHMVLQYMATWAPIACCA